MRPSLPVPRKPPCHAQCSRSGFILHLPGTLAHRDDLLVVQPVGVFCRKLGLGLLPARVVPACRRTGRFPDLVCAQADAFDVVLFDKEADLMPARWRAARRVVDRVPGDPAPAG